MDFILQIILISSAGVIVYVFARALPRVNDEATVPPSKIWLRVEDYIRKLPLQKIDAALSGIIEKSLRKARVVVMKLENAVNAGIHKVRNGKNGSNSEKESAKDLFDQK